MAWSLLLLTLHLLGFKRSGDGIEVKAVIVLKVSLYAASIATFTTSTISALATRLFQIYPSAPEACGGNLLIKLVRHGMPSGVGAIFARPILG
jgi:hypothetical protein